jgi:hypothetical protein
MCLRDALTLAILLTVCTVACQDAQDSTDTREVEAEAFELREQEREQLELLGYVNFVPIADGSEQRRGVTLHDRERAFQGYNLYNPRSEDGARLIDMEGRVVHRWTSNVRGATLAAYRSRLSGRIPRFVPGWNHVELLDDGGVLAIGTHDMLLRLDRDSNVIWKRDMLAHHDIASGLDGDFHVLVDEIRGTKIDGRHVYFQDTLITSVSPEGELGHSISLFDSMSDPKWKPLLEPALRRLVQIQPIRLQELRGRALRGAKADRETARLYEEAIRGELARDKEIKNLLFHNNAEDIFHANSIQVLPRAEPGLWREGDFLVSILRMNMIAVIDHESGEMIWSWGRQRLQEQHHATQLPNGDVLLFDNGTRRRFSRILRIDPDSGRVLWKYQADPPGSFFSAKRGGAQLLPNGNVLVANTDSGHAFEVTPEGERVWEFFTEPIPVAGNELVSTRRPAIYRMQRFPPDRVRSLLDGSAGRDSDAMVR